MSTSAILQLGLLLAAIIMAPSASAQAKDAACVKCHEDIVKREVRHEALDSGCAKCHSTLDATVTPHVNKGPVKLGLAAKGGELCFSCHKKEAFTKKVRHSAIRSGCSGCHDAHSSKHPKLLTEANNELCFGCHEKKDFEGKSVHAPVQEGTCTDCHGPHSTDEPNLLTEPQAELCLFCHSKVKKRPHAAAGFSREGHPIGGEKPGIKDPVRPEREFSCLSCHDPHRSKQVKLLSHEGEGMNFCQPCHKK